MNFPIKISITLLLLYLCIQETFAKILLEPKENDDVGLTVPQLITKHGYQSETHQVVTPDKYILTLHRIPHGRKKQKTGKKKKVLFLMHGLLATSADWILSGPGNALAYLMADRGYDVWMGNARGNFYSRKHAKLDPDKDAEFWHFSWHEIGVIDLPTKIDYILKQTGAKSLYYSGHSQGTTVFYVMTSMKPEYNKKIKVHVSLAPIGFMNHLTSPLLRVVTLFERSLKTLLPLIGVNEFMPSHDFLKKLTEPVCRSGRLAETLCENGLFALVGFSYKEMNETLLPAILSHVPAGASTRQLLHYGQEINSGHFRQYDYGLIKNIFNYWSLSPPDYKLHKITAPVYFIYSRNDWMADRKSVV